MGAGVQPGESPVQGLDLELAVGEELLVHARDLQFSACGRLDLLGYVHYFVGVKIQADHGIVALGLLRLFLDGEAVPIRVELRHAVTLRIVHPVAENRGLGILLGGAHRFFEERGEIVAVEDVVPQDQAHAVVTDELLADEEGLCEAVRGGLLGVGKTDPVVGTVAQQAPEAREVQRGTDDQDVADAREHQDADRIIDHRLVVDGQQLLADALGDRVEPGAGAAGEDDAFHIGRR